jgi:hypothetical protein
LPFVCAKTIPIPTERQGCMAVPDADWGPGRHRTCRRCAAAALQCSAAQLLGSDGGTSTANRLEIPHDCTALQSATLQSMGEHCGALQSTAVRFGIPPRHALGDLGGCKSCTNPRLA